MKVVTAAEMRRMETEAMAAGETQERLMDRAGRALASETQTALGGSAQGRPVMVLVGPGNNGGDGLVAARYLALLGADVAVAPASERPSDDPLLAACINTGLAVLAVGELQATQLQTADAVIDALLGTGHSRGLGGELLRLVEMVRAEQSRRRGLIVVAADVPSGMDADTGAIDSATLGCDLTVTFGLPKHGHFRHPGADATGRLVVADIGLPSALASGITTELLTPDAIIDLLPVRDSSSNKGSFGRVLTVGGCANYMGAPVLACRAALRTGAGLVTLATPRSVSQAMAASTLEITHLPLPETAEGGVAADDAALLEDAVARYDALVIGCGMGQSAGASAFLEALLLDGMTIDAGVVVDADGLNLLAGIPEWWDALPKRAVLTPHPGEMARLLDTSTAEVQRDRIATTREAAERWGRIVVLKGAYTVIAEPSGRVSLAPFANPALATAGTGDVLAGAIGALMAQGLAPFEAAKAGVFLHGLAGETYRLDRGEAGLLASELTEYLPGILRDLRAGRTTDWGRIIEWRGLSA